ncbi:MAG: hypothetical protein KF878_07705 [Planctomycetes bacterium]|nr:hypothetical protein [Planctomycetota bacterium]
MLLAARRLLRGGPRATYYREVVLPRILETPPISGTTNGACEIHALTCAADWLCLIWTLKSFYRVTDHRYRLCIHGDPTLTSAQALTLRAHFPDARVIESATALTEARRRLQSHPRCLAFRERNHLSPKVVDFLHFLEADRLLILDSDLLFFSRPAALLDRVEGVGRVNAFNGDVASAYTVDPDLVRARCGIVLPPRINSGLALVHRESLRLDWLEEFLALEGIDSHFWRQEQTLLALCSARFGVELLPPEYDVRLDRGPPGPCRHYVGAIRQRFFSEGIRLLRAGLLEERGSSCAS